MLLKKRLSPGLPKHSLRFYAACLRLNPIAVGNQIVGGLLDLIRRQLPSLRLPRQQSVDYLSLLSPLS
jgi:hypothetical protein